MALVPGLAPSLRTPVGLRAHHLTRPLTARRLRLQPLGLGVAACAYVKRRKRRWFWAGFLSISINFHSISIFRMRLVFDFGRLKGSGKDSADCQAWLLGRATQHQRRDEVRHSSDVHVDRTAWP